MAARKKELKFEEAIQKLQNIVNSIEDDELSLEESLKMFQEGMELAALCNKKLDEAEAKINIVMKGSEGQLLEEEFETGED